MTIRKPAPGSAMLSSTLLASALAASLLPGCTQTTALPQSRSPIYVSDLQGKAAVCTAPAVTPEGGKAVTATMTTGGGGWCGLTVADNGKPFAAGLVERRPDKGHVFIHTVGDETRVDYTPDATVVADSFAVKLLPGDATVTVSVQPAEAPAAAAAPPANKGVAK